MSTAEREERPLFREAPCKSSILSLSPGTSSKSWCRKVYLKVNTYAYRVKSICKVNRVLFPHYKTMNNKHYLLRLFIPVSVSI